MASKCVHKGCGKVFDDPEEPCIYHPGPPVFHEGQKGWKCCKPRVLTFDEFLVIPPCTTGKHSTVDDTPTIESRKPAATTSEAGSALPDRPAPEVTPVATTNNRSVFQPGLPPAINPPSNTASPAPPESESDDPSLEIPPNSTCRRKGCKATYDSTVSREEEKCAYHPGHPIFHEGSKGWSCCKRRVLEFDQFMKIEGCKEKAGHVFIGKGRPAGEEKIDDVRNDFYQTPTTVNASLYLKKIDKASAKVEFSATAINLDLPTADNKRLRTTYNLFAPIDPEKSQYRVLNTKLDLTLVKADATNWPVLRSDDRWTGQRIQIGQAGRI